MTQTMPAPPAAAGGLAAAVKHRMPGWDETTAAIERVRAQARTLPAPAPTLPSVDQLAAAAEAGESLPDDLGARYAADQAAAAKAKAHRGLHTAVLEALRNRLEEIERTNADDALRYLDEELQDLIRAARAALVEMGAARTGEAAARAGETERSAWVRFDDLTDGLRILRRVQHDVVLTATGSRDSARTLLRYAGEIANLAEVVPDWRDIQRGRPNGQIVSGYDTGSGVLEPPWRFADRAEPLFPLVDRDYLTWLCESGAVPWVPTTRDMRDVNDTLLHPPIPRDERAQAAHDAATSRLDAKVRSHRGHAAGQAEIEAEHEALTATNRARRPTGDTW